MSMLDFSYNNTDLGSGNFLNLRNDYSGAGYINNFNINRNMYFKNLAAIGTLRQGDLILGNGIGNTSIKNLTFGDSKNNKSVWDPSYLHLNFRKLSDGGSYQFIDNLIFNQSIKNLSLAGTIVNNIFFGSSNADWLLINNLSCDNINLYSYKDYSKEYRITPNNWRINNINVFLRNSSISCSLSEVLTPVNTKISGSSNAYVHLGNYLDNCKPGSTLTLENINATVNCGYSGTALFNMKFGKNVNLRIVYFYGASRIDSALTFNKSTFNFIGGYTRSFGNCIISNDITTAQYPYYTGSLNFYEAGLPAKIQNGANVDYFGGVGWWLFDANNIFRDCNNVGLNYFCPRDADNGLMNVGSSKPIGHINILNGCNNLFYNAKNVYYASSGSSFTLYVMAAKRAKFAFYKAYNLMKSISAIQIPYNTATWSTTDESNLKRDIIRMFRPSDSGDITSMKFIETTDNGIMYNYGSNIYGENVMLNVYIKDTWYNRIVPIQRKFSRYESNGYYQGNNARFNIW